MERENKNKSFLIWFEEFWEEIEIQFYGIIGAILFFVVIYIFFKPPWMNPIFELFSKNKLPLG
tara:strand:- start:123 stop:311 length:189 start_codon:yes stop_codon:yes gene_type:complete